MIIQVIILVIVLLIIEIEVIQSKLKSDSYRNGDSYIFHNKINRYINKLINMRINVKFKKKSVIFI